MTRTALPRRVIVGRVVIADGERFTFDNLASGRSCNIFGEVRFFQHGDIGRERRVAESGTLTISKLGRFDEPLGGKIDSGAVV